MDELLTKVMIAVFICLGIMALTLSVFMVWIMFHPEAFNG